MKVVVYGASGKVGRLVVREALARGWEVAALVRDPAKADLAGARVHRGDVTLAADVGAVLAGADAVISTVGHAPGAPKDVLTVFADHLVPRMRDAGVRRLVTLVGAGVSAPGDGPPNLGRRVMRGLLGLLARSMFEDAQRHADRVFESGLDFVVARPPRLTDDPPTGRIEAAPYAPLGPSAQLTRADLAAFLVAQVTEDRFVRAAPMVWNAG